MKKIKNLLFLLLCLFSVATINVNATTYTSNKRINFKEFENVEDAEALLKYNGKSYILKDDYTFGKLEELVIGEKVSTKTTNYTELLLDEIYPNKLIQDYSFVYGELDLVEVTVGGIFAGQGPIELNEDIPVGGEGTVSSFDLDGFYNKKLYISVDVSIYDEITDENEDIDDYIVVYNEQYKLEKTLKFSELTKNYIGENVELWDFSLMTYETVDTEDPLIVAHYRYWEEDKLIRNFLIFDVNGNLLIKISEDNQIEDIVPVYSNGKLNIAYISFAEEYSKASLKVTDGTNVRTILQTDEFISFQNYNGLIVVSGDRNVIYDSDFNLIKEYVDVNDIEVIKEITNEKEVIAILSYSNVYKEVQNGNYLVKVYKEVEDDSFEGLYNNVLIKNELLTIEDSKKTSISGNLKDNNGNPLKDYIVELYSTVKTYTTDKDGYFKFEDVEEGKHTLVVKKSDGTILVNKEINIVEGTETKLVDNTLYFNLNDKGMNLNIKVDGDKLVIDSVDKGVKEPSKNIIEKLEDVVVPKTSDGILAYILIFGMLIGASVYLIRKNKGIKYTNIK